MMTQQLGFSVLAAPIAALDRRALSQAWYSALHLARDGAKTRSGTVTRLEPRAATCEAAIESTPPATKPRSTVESRAMPKNGETRTQAGGDVERRAPRSPLARKIERLFLHPQSTAKRATFDVAGSGARVHVSIQASRSGLRLVAVCPPRVREAVARALNEARFALAARGIALDARVSGSQCS